MLFFKRILKEPAPAPAAEAPRVERRSMPRYIVNQQFPLKATLSYIGRDDTGAPMSNSRHGWNWKGRLIDCSELGARIQMGQAPKVGAKELCDLKLSISDFELTIPCHIENARENPDGLVFGLRHCIEDEATRNAYWQLLEVLALGSTLKPRRRTEKPDASGYVVEQYASSRPALLTVWRHPDDGEVSAFEFQLKDNLVRGEAEGAVQYLTGARERPATAASALEIQRLFSWVVPNLSDAVPEDVRAFLKHYMG